MAARPLLANVDQRAIRRARALAVLEHTYPAWHIRDHAGRLSASRVRTPTPRQRAAGLHQHILQPTIVALAAILAQQLDISQRFR